MTDLTISGLRALLDADTVTDAPVGSIVDTRDWDGDEGDRLEWMRTGREATSWWLVDGDEDDYSDTEQLMLAGGLLSAVAVPVGLLRELLDAAAERDQLRQRVAELEAALGVPPAGGPRGRAEPLDDAVARWIKQRRDEHVEAGERSGVWWVLDGLLDEYREHHTTGTVNRIANTTEAGQ